MDASHGEAGILLLEVEVGLGANALRCQVGLAELARQRHRETRSVRGGHQLFRIRAGTILETIAKTVTHVVQGAAGARYLAGTVLETALPLRRRGALHRENLRAWPGMVPAGTG